jgi:hypothetical protein
MAPMQRRKWTEKQVNRATTTASARWRRRRWRETVTCRMNLSRWIFIIESLSSNLVRPLTKLENHLTLRKVQTDSDKQIITREHEAADCGSSGRSLPNSRRVRHKGEPAILTRMGSATKEIDGAEMENWIGVKHELRVRERDKTYALVPC